MCTCVYITVTIYNQFWDWVDHHCPASMSMDSCQGCFDYSGQCV